MSVEGTTAHDQLLANLATAMRATAETAQQATLDQCQVDAKSYAERLHARSEDERQELRQAADEDVATIEARSKASIARVRAEAEQRIERRRQLLEQELQEYHSAVDREIERVQEKVTAFEKEVSQFFERLLENADPAEFATMASQAPNSPPFTEEDIQTLATELQDMHEDAAREADEQAAAPKEELPEYWWLDSPTSITAQAHHEEEPA
jgi:tRNA/tmRNA/rRNA uracil-C5-methylase (TrmA/RlmC/RlmD family)